MYSKIMVPVDLAHVDRLEKAIATATDLARHYGIPLCFVGVTAQTPTEVAHNVKEYGEKLKAFGAAQASSRGLEVETAAYSSHDPAVDLNHKLIAAAGELGCDLIVMGSHLPGFPEHFFSSHAGAVASHARISVFVVR